MGTPLARKIIRIPGRLIADPANLTTAPDYGGTLLGMVRDEELRFGYSTKLVTAEEWGNKPVEAVYAGEMALFAAVLRELDNDMVSRMFPRTVAGSSSGDRVIQYNPSAASGATPGTLLSSNAFTLLFAPKSPEHPAVILYNAIPLLEEASVLQTALDEEIGIGVVFQGIPDSSNRVYAIGKLEDLSL